MKKPASLRDMLLRTVPGLAANPGQLDMHVDAGRIEAREGGTLSFRYRYMLTIVVLDYVGSIDAITVPILAWISQNEPLLMRRDDAQPFAFEAEILADDKADINIGLELAERVRVLPREGGGFDLEYLPEPPADPDRIPGVCGNLWQIFMHDELVTPVVDPASLP